MADDTPVITVKREISRPDPALVDRFRGAPSGNVSDAADRGNTLWPVVKPVTPLDRICGVALTVDAGPHDNLAVWAALEHIREGDVLMISTGNHDGCAVVGDLILSFARNSGAVGVVTDGMVRDAEMLAGIDLPVFARGIRPSGPHKRGPGAVGMPITIAGQRVASGDVVVADRDGVVVVPRAMLSDAADRVDAIAAKEAGMEAAGKAGKRMPDNIGDFLDGVRIVEAE